MRLTFLDIETGKVYPCDSDMGIWWWAEGNGGDDCNRTLFVGVDDDEDEDGVGRCCGATRMLAVEVRDVVPGGRIPPHEHESDSWARGADYDLEFLSYLNDDYPDGHELVEAAWHGRLEPLPSDPRLISLPCGHAIEVPPRDVDGTFGPCPCGHKVLLGQVALQGRIDRAAGRCFRCRDGTPGSHIVPGQVRQACYAWGEVWGPIEGEEPSRIIGAFTA